MANHPNQQPDLTEAEKRFLGSLKTLFSPDGSALVGIQAQVYEATEKLLAGQGEASLEEVINTGREAFAQMHGKILTDAYKRVRSAAASIAYETDPKIYAEKEEVYATATKQLERLELRSARDTHAMLPEETLALAKNAGLTSGFSKEDRTFIDGIKKLFDANGGASSFQEELTESLTRAAIKQGTLNQKEILGILEKAHTDDVSMRAELEKRYGSPVGKVDYDEEIPLPQIQKLMDKSGIKSSER